MKTKNLQIGPTQFIPAKEGETYEIAGHDFPVTAHFDWYGQEIPLVDIPQVSEVKWHKMCLESRLKHPELYRDNEDVDAMIEDLKKKIEKCEIKEQVTIKTPEFNNETSIYVYDWMLKDLNLKRNELIIYAAIYGFMHDNISEFNCSLQFLADCIGSSKNAAKKCISSLVRQKLLEKRVMWVDDVKVYQFTCKGFKGKDIESGGNTG